MQLGFGDIKAKFSTLPADRPHRQGRRRPAAALPRDPAEGRDRQEARRRRSTVEIFDGVQYVDVIGTSKGKGIAGVMKRHHFGGQPASHGTERKHRSPGSIASRATWRGQSRQAQEGRPHGRPHGHRISVTTRNHPLVKIDADNNLLLIKGALPGPNGGLLFVRKSSHRARSKAEAK